MVPFLAYSNTFSGKEKQQPKSLQLSPSLSFIFFHLLPSPWLKYETSSPPPPSFFFLSSSYESYGLDCELRFVDGNISDGLAP
jgi:hypothetical protein